MEDLELLMDCLHSFKGKRVFITGCTGFKGAWISYILSRAGADVSGFSLRPPTHPNLYDIANIEDLIRYTEGDIRDYPHLLAAIQHERPEFLIHLAAQPIVLDGYKDPRYTYETNLMGTINVLEAVRHTESVRSAIVITTDKVYRNDERPGYGYQENDVLNGKDPYSNSKSCADIATQTYRRCFLAENNCALSILRAGNVIGGGDFAPHRIIPDCVRALEENRPVFLRNPDSVRPYQHVLEPAMAYLMVMAAQYHDQTLADDYNVGPKVDDCLSTYEVATLFMDAVGGHVELLDQNQTNLLESGFLALNSEKIQRILGWQPTWSAAQAIEATAEWTNTWRRGDDIRKTMDHQIHAYIEESTTIK